MKKQLTLFLALMIGVVGFGATKSWKPVSGSNSWALGTNWSPPNAPANGDFVIFNLSGASQTVTNVPDMNLNGFVVRNPDNLGYTLTLRGSVAGNNLRINYDAAASFEVELQPKVTLNCNSGTKLNLILSPGARMQVDATLTAGSEAIFLVAEYGDCESGRGFVLEANSTRHAEMVQQNVCSTPIRGFMQYEFNEMSDYKYVSVPITTDIMNGDPDAGTDDVCRKANSLCFLAGNNVRRYDAPSQSWGSWMGNYSNCYHTDLNLTAGNGYEIYVQNTSAEIYGNFCSPATAAWPLINSTVAGNWYLVGNPFPSGITFNGNAGSGLIGWTWETSKIKPWVCYYNSTANSYYYYMWDNTLPNVPIAIPAIAQMNMIPRGQAFFVQAITNSAELGVSNIAREFKSTTNIGKSEQSNGNILYMTLSGSDGRTCNSVVQFKENGSSYMTDWDMNRFPGEDPSVSTIYFKKDKYELVYSNLESTNESSAVPLYLRATTSGTFTLTADQISSFNNNSSILLKDIKTNTTIDLKAVSSYTFTASAGDDEGRFMLFFSNVLGVNNLTVKDFKVYSANKTIYVQNSNVVAGSVSVYDMVGKEVYNTQLNNDQLMQINATLAKGYYVVTVKTQSGVLTQKVFIN